MGKPKVRFKNFEDEWVRRKLGEIASLITKGTTPHDKSGIGDVNFIKVENIDSISGEITDTSKISIDEHEGYLKRSQLQVGDILFSIAGTLGRVTTIKEQHLPANTNQALAIIRLKEGQLEFVKTSLKGNVVADFIRKNPTVGAQPNLSLEQVSSLQIMIPNNTEQIKIGNYFHTLDNLITLHRRELNNTKTLKKYMLQNMFPQNGESVPKIRFKGFTDDWEQRKFSNMVIRKSVTFESNSEFPSVEYEDIISECGLLNKDVRKKEITKVGIKFEQGDILFGKLRPYLKNWLLPNFSGVAVGDFWVLKPIEIDSKYLYSFIQSPLYGDIANQSSGTKMPRSDWNLVSNFDFYVSKNTEEQKQIGAYFSTLDNLITLHRQKCDELQNFKKFMLQTMFV